MARLIALEWDSSEARVAVARTRGSAMELQRTCAIDLTACPSRSPRDIGVKIGQELKTLGIGGGDVSVAVGRSNIELRFLSVPPVPEDELPDVVRFQASRQFSQPLEDGQLDFAPLLSSGQPPTTVLAAAISAEMLKTIRETCEAAGLSPKHLALRPFAASSLVTDKVAADVCFLTIDLLAEETDLTVILGQQAVFPRTVRLGQNGSADDKALSLLMEVRRTIAAAQNQIDGKRVTELLIFGREADHASQAAVLTRELQMPVKIVDPFATIQWVDESARETMTHSGRFAPLIGLLVDAAKGKRQEIDFLAPRKRPDPPDLSRVYTLAGTAAALLVFLLSGYLWWSLSSLDAEIERYANDIKKTDKLTKAGKATLEHVKLLDEFAAGQVSWVEELRDLSVKLPPADAVMIQELKGNVGAVGGRLLVSGGAKSEKDVSILEANLRDDQHRVAGQGVQKTANEPRYPYQFEETITIAPASEKTSKSATTLAEKKS